MGNTTINDQTNINAEKNYIKTILYPPRKISTLEKIKEKQKIVQIPSFYQISYAALQQQIKSRNIFNNQHRKVSQSISLHNENTQSFKYNNNKKQSIEFQAKYNNSKYNCIQKSLIYKNIRKQWKYTINLNEKTLSTQNLNELFIINQANIKDKNKGLFLQTFQFKEKLIQLQIHKIRSLQYFLKIENIFIELKNIKCKNKQKIIQKFIEKQFQSLSSNIIFNENDINDNKQLNQIPIEVKIIGIIKVPNYTLKDYFEFKKRSYLSFSELQLLSISNFLANALYFLSIKQSNFYSGLNKNLNLQIENIYVDQNGTLKIIDPTIIQSHHSLFNTSSIIKRQDQNPFKKSIGLHEQSLQVINIKKIGYLILQLALMQKPKKYNFLEGNNKIVTQGYSFDLVILIDKMMNNLITAKGVIKDTDDKIRNKKLFFKQHHSFKDLNNQQKDYKQSIQSFYNTNRNNNNSINKFRYKNKSIDQQQISNYIYKTQNLNTKTWKSGKFSIFQNQNNQYNNEQHLSSIRLPSQIENMFRSKHQLNNRQSHRQLQSFPQRESTNYNKNKTSQSQTISKFKHYYTQNYNNQDQSLNIINNQCNSSKNQTLSTLHQHSLSNINMNSTNIIKDNRQIEEIAKKNLSQGLQIKNEKLISFEKRNKLNFIKKKNFSHLQIKVQMQEILNPTKNQKINKSEDIFNQYQQKKKVQFPKKLKNYKLIQKNITNNNSSNKIKQKSQEQNQKILNRKKGELHLKLFNQLSSQNKKKKQQDQKISDENQNYNDGLRHHLQISSSSESSSYLKLNKDENDYIKQNQKNYKQLNLQQENSNQSQKNQSLIDALSQSFKIDENQIQNSNNNSKNSKNLQNQKNSQKKRKGQQKSVDNYQVYLNLSQIQAKSKKQQNSFNSQNSDKRKSSQNDQNNNNIEGKSKYKKQQQSLQLSPVSYVNEQYIQNSIIDQQIDQNQQYNDSIQKDCSQNHNIQDNSNNQSQNYNSRTYHIYQTPRNATIIELTQQQQEYSQSESLSLQNQNLQIQKQQQHIDHNKNNQIQKRKKQLKKDIQLQDNLSKKNKNQSLNDKLGRQLQRHQKLDKNKINYFYHKNNHYNQNQYQENNLPFDLQKQNQSQNQSFYQNNIFQFVSYEADGQFYQGYINPQGLKQGIGKLINKQGYVYQGQWHQNKKHGFGKLYFIQKKLEQFTHQKSKSQTKSLVYQGDWKQDIFHGKGKFYNPFPYKQPREQDFSYTDTKPLSDYQNDYKNLSKDIIQQKWHFYDGMFINGSKQGNGTLKFYNGQTLQGQWKNDQINGQGIYYTLTGNIIKGVWKQGNLIQLFQ